MCIVAHRPITPHSDCLGSYLAPLDESASEVLLPYKEHKTHRVFAIADWRTDDTRNRQPRWAVCQPCPREQWSRLTHGEVIIYTELYTYEEGDDEPGTTSLETHVGRVLVYDDERKLFYATRWNVGENKPYNLAADDVQDVWHVVRFIPALQA